MNTIIDKLLTKHDHRGDGLPTQYVNPDGPDAVAFIRQQAAENDALRDRVATLEDAGKIVLSAFDSLNEELSPNQQVAEYRIPASAESKVRCLSEARAILTEGKD